ncbi:MAG: hypothetical protein IT287_04570 [Bdellovibrionaceae bacterium]|nr:hypothetical protein [Pseudobdellovibrionaceae bacterium]
MKSIIFSFLLLSTISANADVIDCYFFEPFYKIVIDTDAKTLTHIDIDWYDSAAQAKKSKVVFKDIVFVKTEAKSVSLAVDVPRYQVKDKGQTVMELELSYQGRDGVYDFAYPYEVRYKKHNSGACQSDKIKRLNLITE